jgi:hypothetical protein
VGALSPTVQAIAFHGTANLLPFKEPLAVRSVLMMPQKAVVIGSGMGGLTTAQVLSRYFEQVVVVERDQPQPLMEQSAVDAALQEVGARPGVKQASHGSMRASSRLAWRVCNRAAVGLPSVEGSAALSQMWCIVSQQLCRAFISCIWKTTVRVPCG